MISAGQHQSKLLISITNGKKLGEIKDLYFDSESVSYTHLTLPTKRIV